MTDRTFRDILETVATTGAHGDTVRATRGEWTLRLPATRDAVASIVVLVDCRLGNPYETIARAREVIGR